MGEKKAEESLLSALVECLPMLAHDSQGETQGLNPGWKCSNCMIICGARPSFGGSRKVMMVAGGYEGAGDMVVHKVRH
jgi:hypothetical protein